MGLQLFKKQLENSKIIDRGEYRYIINAICEQDPPLEPSILEDCANKLLERMTWQGANKILTPEAMGIHIATTISLKTSLPMIIATHRRKFTMDEIPVNYVCGYESGKLHINGIKENDKILLIDDLISTGGTAISLIDAIRKIGAEVVDFGVIFNKIDYGGMTALRKMGLMPKTLLDVRLNGDIIEVSEC